MANMRSWKALAYRLLASGSFGLAIVPLVLPAPPPGPGQWDLKPPGDCTQEVHDELQAEVNKKCKDEEQGRYKCTNQKDCDTLKRNRDIFTGCIAARKTIMDRCFRKGNLGHQKALSDAERGLKKCNELIDDPKGPCAGKILPCPKE
jgi:hypothetical protein